MSTSLHVAVVPVSTVSQIKALSDPVDDVKLFPVKLTVPVPVKLTLPSELVKFIPEGEAIVFASIQQFQEPLSYLFLKVLLVSNQILHPNLKRPK